MTDNDETLEDDNSENGNAITLAYSYRFSKKWFLQLEYNRIDSDRLSRTYHGQPLSLSESQWQMGTRYFF